MWIVIRSGCYVLLKAGRNDKETVDHLAADLYCTCHIGVYIRSVSKYTYTIMYVNSHFTLHYINEFYMLMIARQQKRLCQMLPQHVFCRTLHGAIQWVVDVLPVYTPNLL